MTVSVDPEWWKHLFDEVYLLTDARSVCDPEITSREIDLICSILGLKRDDAILDLCGGQGRHSLELYGRGYRCCTLVDYSRFLLRQAEKSAAQRGYDLPCIQSDARNTRLQDNSFDYVLILGNSLGYCIEPDADLLIVQEALRLLRPGGRVLIDVVDGRVIKQNFNSNAWHEIGDDTIVCRQRELRSNRVDAREIVLSKRKGIIRDQTYSIRYYFPDSLEKLLACGGFQQIDVQTDFTPHTKPGDYGCMDNRMIATGRKP
jgi:D-alanine-D-alanine ligase